MTNAIRKILYAADARESALTEAEELISSSTVDDGEAEAEETQ